MNTHSEAASSSQKAAAHPMARCAGPGGSAQELAEPVGHPLDLDGELVAVEERHVVAHAADRSRSTGGAPG